MDELRALALAEIAMSSEERVEINIAIRDLWLVVNALQLSMTHKALHEPLRGWMEEIGVRCQDVITSVLPEVGELLEMGWHRENDVTSDDDPGAPGGWYDDDNDDDGPRLPPGVTVEEIGPNDPDWIPF